MILPLLLASLVSVPSSAKGTQVYCADQAGNQKKPGLTVKAGGGNTLFLCAVNAKKRKGVLQVSGFKVFSLTKAGKKRGKPVFESELENKDYSATARGEELVLNELVWNGKEKAPGFETLVSCEASACRASAATCVFKKPASPGTGILGQIEEYRHGKRQGKVPAPKLIDRLAHLAYSGHEEALAVFKDRGGMSLDGEASERYYEHQEAIERLRKAGCF